MTHYSKSIQESSNTAMIAELVSAYCLGILGVGHALAGRAWMTTVLTLTWWASTIVGYLFASLTLGLGALIVVPFILALPVFSALWVRQVVCTEERPSDWNSALLGIGILAVVVTVLGILFFSGVLGLGALLVMMAG